jgi:uncharacterized phage protein gp47/JayE
VQLQLRTFDRVVASGAAAVQGAARAALDLSVGSVLRAVLEANAGVALWLQWLILQVLQTTRAATSNGGDLDSWMADFGLRRQPATVAGGQASFARFAPVTAALLPAGTMARTADGAQSFVVVADPGHAAWNAALGGYALAAGVASVTAPVVAATAGAAGNVQAGAISLIAAAVPGVDTVANAAPIAGGLDAESDAALRARFAAYLASLSKATPAAVGYAVASVQQGLQWTIAENATPSGAYQPGCFVVTVDNGSGAPPAGLLTAVSGAIEAVRPVGSIWTVRPPTVSPASATLSITTAAGASHADAVAAVTAAITQFINALPVGAALRWSRLAQVAYDASDAVTNVTGVRLNGGTDDLAPGRFAVVKSSSVTVA